MDWLSGMVFPSNLELEEMIYVSSGAPFSLKYLYNCSAWLMSLGSSVKRDTSRSL
jgi:hypothetical protein